MEGQRGSVLVVDDEPTIAEVVSPLPAAGRLRRPASPATAARRSSSRATLRPDLVVLDLMLPGIDGLEVMRRIRETDRDRTAVILLTAKGEESDRVIGLRLGADDYVVKPFSPAELVARVDAVLRRIDTSPDVEEPLVFDGLRIEPAARRVLVDGEEVAAHRSASSTSCSSSPGIPGRCSTATSSWTRSGSTPSTPTPRR